ncbi:outer membrane beta-barrel protein [Paraglaciecola sp. 2405UD69-4]|uniref:outer membrane beta-barrel protein n=1 Tax=Paraglaciecola sp. 2405UD69-4 TaxID=3391836 RepID=UPI0039C9B8AC
MNSQELGFRPEVWVNLVSDSNVFRTTSKVDDNILLVNPTFSYAIQNGKNVFEGSYVGNYATFFSNKDLNYDEHNLSLSSLFDFSARFKTELDLTYLNEIEAPGTNNALATQFTEFNQREDSNFVARFLYGSQQSSGQFVLQYTYRDLNYSNNGQEFRDYISNMFKGTFFYRVAPRTRLLLEGSLSNLSYQNTQVIDLSSIQSVYSLGVQWNNTDLITSVFKIGYQDVDFDDNNRSDLSGLSYFVNLTWQATPNSIVRVDARRAAQESAEQFLGGYISSIFTFNLTHDITDNTTMSFRYSYTDNDFKDSLFRKDETQGLTTRLAYNSKDWLLIYAEYTVNKRDSSIQQFNFDANIISVGVKLSFN